MSWVVAVARIALLQALLHVWLPPRVGAYDGLSALGSATPPLPRRFYEAKSPKLLLHEWCLREKVPRPRYRPTAMEGGLWKCKVGCSRVTVCMERLRSVIDSRRGRSQEAARNGRLAKAHLLAGVHATAAIAATVVWSTLLLQRSMMLVCWAGLHTVFGSSVHLLDAPTFVLIDQPSAWCRWCCRTQRSRSWM